MPSLKPLASTAEPFVGDGTELPTHQRRYLVEHVTCPMCESDLRIIHDIKKHERKVEEEAHCPQCGVRARKITHDLH